MSNIPKMGHLPTPGNNTQFFQVPCLALQHLALGQMIYCIKKLTLEQQHTFCLEKNNQSKATTWGCESELVSGQPLY